MAKIQSYGSPPYDEGELKRLPERKHILRSAKKRGIGAEIGVFRGLFSEILARELRPKRFYLVDPWRKLGTHFTWRSPMTAQGELTTECALNDTKERMAQFPDSDVRIVEDYSFSFLEQTKELFDWLYIDSTHTHPDTIKELRLAADKLQPDGVIMGDDWTPSPQSKHHGVFVAVNQFVKETDFVLVEAGREGQWCIRRATQTIKNLHVDPPLGNVNMLRARIAELWNQKRQMENSLSWRITAPLRKLRRMILPADRGRFRQKERANAGPGNHD